MINKKKLIVNADDFGLTRSVSEGIIEANKKGIVTTTTVMMNQEFTEEALKLSKAAPNLELGVHLVFNSGKPVLDVNEVSSLVSEQGMFQKNIFDFRERVKDEELFNEFCAQVDKFIKLYGEKPAHIDCHHWVILFPRFFECYLRVAEKYNVPIRKPILDLENFSDNGLKDLMGNVYGKNLEESFSKLELEIINRKIKCPDNFRAGFYNKQANIEYLENIINNIPEGTTELMTHAGFVNDELMNKSSYNVGRKNEFNILTDDRVKELLEKNNISLINFSCL